MFLKRLNKEIQLYKKDNFCFPNLIIQPSDNLNIWYFIIYGLNDTDFNEGIFLGKVLLPEKYPLHPPDFIFLTENGRFKTNVKICTSFTGFHKDLYSPSWNILSMLTGLISFMTDPQDTPDSNGLGGIKTSKEEKKLICKSSVEIIKTNEIYKQFFNQFQSVLFTGFNP
jgi:ubiquitin-protein ligase